MDSGLLTVLALGFLLGIKHAVEPDHIIAVSTIATRSKRIIPSAFSGVFWGIGHTATLLVAGVFLIFMKVTMPEKWAMSLEFLVGIMLVYLGASTIISAKKRHAHDHTHNSSNFRSSYLKSLLIGFIHGLAGSGALVVLTLSTVSGIGEGLAYISFFGVGTIIGMLFFTTFISLPFVLSSKKLRINRGLIRVTGLISTLFGIYYMYNLGVTEGLFRLLLY